MIGSFDLAAMSCGDNRNSWELALIVSLTTVFFQDENKPTRTDRIAIFLRHPPRGTCGRQELRWRTADNKSARQVVVKKTSPYDSRG